MPATVRYDEQYCPIARALDVLGDRWTLLILRELLIGDQRFTDLRRTCPASRPTVLTQRLRTLTDQGLIDVKELPPPAARSVYTLTDKGRSVTPVLRALTRWGMPLLEAPTDDSDVRPWTAANAALSMFYDESAATGIDERYLMRIDGEEFWLSSILGGGDARPQPDLTLEATAATWIDVRQDAPRCARRSAAGNITKTGSRAALDHFAAIFQLR